MMAQVSMFEDLHLLALVASTMERFSTDKPTTPHTTECTASKATSCTSNEALGCHEKNQIEVQNSGRSSPMMGDEIVYKNFRFRKTRECHRCYAEADLAELEQRIENLRDAFSFWEYLRGYLRTNEMNPRLERSFRDFMELVKKI